MSDPKDILVAHYTQLLKRVATWVGIGSLIATTMIASPASAVGTQMGARSVTPTSLKAGLTTTSYAITINPGTTGTVGSIRFDICDSPLESVSCAGSGSSVGADLSPSTFTSVTGTGWTGGTWVTNGTVAASGANGTAAKWKNTGTAIAPTTAQPGVWTFGSVKNPTTNNSKFFLRVTSYSDTNNTTEVDFGAMALQTAQDLTISAQVQESLEFCVGATVPSGCGSVGSAAVSLGTGTGCPILSIANVCTGTSQMAAATNASTGYSITYLGTTLTGPSDTITQTGTPGATSSPGSKQFGLAITAQSGATGTIAAVYDFSGNGSKYAFVNGAATQVASAAAAIAETIYTVTYAANVSSITKPGNYTSTFTYVCTGLF